MDFHLSDLVEQEEKRLEIRKAFTILTPKQKNIIRMVYFEGMKVVDVAKQCNVTRQDIYKIHKNAITKMRKYFKCSKTAPVTKHPLGW